MRVRSDGPQLISQMISKYLNIDCSVLMGANIAGEQQQQLWRRPQQQHRQTGLQGGNIMPPSFDEIY